MTSIWKLVEAELSPEAKAKLDSAEKAYADKQAANTNASFNKSKKSNNHRDSRKPQKSNRSDTVYYPDTPETRTYYASLAVEQIELIMSADNLAMDTFLRSYMDEEGYLPIALLRNYPNVASCEAYYEYILDALSTSETFELDLPNETLRLKSKWAQWLMPNGFGGFGCPRYVRQPVTQQHAQVFEQDTADA